MSGTITRLNPEGLHPTPGYHHVTVVEAGRLAFLAGQRPIDRDGHLVGPDNVFAQSDQIARNVLVALAAVGAGPEHVVSAVIYVVSGDEGVLAHVVNHFRQSPIAAAFRSAATLIGVARLGFPGQLIEVDLTAALPAQE
jgi:enamine deaminase RidA (YjgF/YER057c/UK114 family)